MTPDRSLKPNARPRPLPNPHAPIPFATRPVLHAIEDVLEASGAEEKTALFVSPHLDDVAFSCGGVLVALARAGWRVHLCTVFAASVPEPEGFALACQLDKGLPAEVDYMALRRAEDEAFARRAGIALPGALHHLPHAEAPHRGYHSAEALFAGVREGDSVWRGVRDSLADLVEEICPAALFAPQGLGGHVDHVQAIRAVLGLPRRPPTFWYRDAPYAFRHAGAAPSSLLPESLEPLAFDIARELPAKTEAVAAYRSQLGFQFGGEEAMRAALTDFARREAERLGREDGAAEVLARET